MKYRILLLVIFFLPHFSTALSHGVGGGESISSDTPKKYTKPTAPVERAKSISERMTFTLKTKGNVAKLWISNNLNQPMDTSLTSATAIVIDDGQTTLFKMMPTEQGYIIGTIPINISNATRVDVVLRMPGERPINISFTPGQSAQPTYISQQESRQY